jgi:TRAP-type C4-dicarboxylate transport system substrate-binding protein
MRKVMISLIMLVLIGMGVGSAFAGDPVVLKFASIEPPQSFTSQKVFIPWIEQINKDGKGVVEIKYFPGGTLGRNPNRQLTILLDGVTDLVHIINAYHQAGRLADEQVTQTPFVANNCYECALGVEYMQKKKVVRGYDDLVILGQVCLGVYGIHSNFPVKVPADLKGKKMRTAGKMFQGLSEALGCAPVEMPVTKVAEAMSRGVVQATMQDWLGMDVFRINDVAHYHCMVPLGTNLLTVAITKKKYDSLPADARAVIEKYSGPEFSRMWAKKLQKHLKQIEDRIKNDPEHHVYYPNKEEMKQWKAVFAPVIASWGTQIDNWNVLIKTYTEGVEKARAEQK